MAVREFSQTNATGRSGRGLTGSLKKALGPPEGEPWCWLTRELLESDAWCAMSPNLNRLIHFLLVEHMNHAGTENGNLAATYDQLVAYGCTRGRINAAIAEGCYLGLIDADHGGRWAGTNQVSTDILSAPRRGATDAPMEGHDGGSGRKMEGQETKSAHAENKSPVRKVTLR